MLTPRVSVITATYNWSSVLRCAIQSVLGQSMQDFEMLVIGDGCTDDSAEVVASFHDERLRWHNLAQNSGSQSSPNNAGLQMARAPHVAYLGHDDLWYPSHLELGLNALEREGAAAAFARCEIIGPPGSGHRILAGLPDRLQHLEDGGVPPSSLIHRRDVAETIGGWRDYRTLDIPPDNDFIQRIQRHGYRFATLNELTVFKFPSAWRRNSYRERRSVEQLEYMRRMQSEPEFLRDEWRAIAEAYATGKGCMPPEVQVAEAPSNAPSGWLVEQYRSIRGLEPNAQATERTQPMGQRVRRSLARRTRAASRAVLRSLGE